MKKIIALILATVMVMLAVAACGGTGNTTTTGATQGTTTQATTQATTTTEYVAPIPDPVDVVVYYPMGENPVAINISTNEPAGQLTLAEGAEFELVQGNFYVATYYNGESTAKAQLGAALKTSGISLGLTNKRSENAPSRPGALVSTANWWRQCGERKYDMNIFMDTAAMNTAMGDYASIGKFGTIKVTGVVGGEIFLEIDGEEAFASETKVNFAYITYDGKVIKTATNKEGKTPISSASDLLRYAIDIGNGKETGYIASVWQNYLDQYGSPGSTTTCDYEGCGCGQNKQTHWQNAWFAGLIPVNYVSAVNNYNLIALDADALKVVYDNALAAFNTAVAANADIAAKKAAAEADGATDEVKKAYTDALAADANLTALNDAVTAAKKDYDNAVKGDTNADAYTTKYNEQKALFEKFCAAYEEAANTVLWDAEDIENSFLYKQFIDVPEKERVLPTYTYFYDAATDTYTIYVTSAMDANVIVGQWHKN